MPLSLEQLRGLIGQQLVQIGTITPQYQAAQVAADEAIEARNAIERQLQYHQSVLAGLKVTLYDFFERTFIENPQATSYAEMGAAMDAAAAASPEEPPDVEPPP